MVFGTVQYLRFEPTVGFEIGVLYPTRTEKQAYGRAPSNPQSRALKASKFKSSLRSK